MYIKEHVKDCEKMVLVSVYGNVVLSFIGDFTKVANIAKIKIYKLLGIMNASFWRLSGLVVVVVVFISQST